MDNVLMTCVVAGLLFGSSVVRADELPEPRPKPVPTNGNKLVAAGAVLLPLGVALTAGWTYFYIDAGLYTGGGSHGAGLFGSFIFYGPGFIGLGAMAAGISLLAMGAKRNNQAAQQALTANVMPRVQLAPYASSAGAGLFVLGRY